MSVRPGDGGVRVFERSNSRAEGLPLGVAGLVGLIAGIWVFGRHPVIGIGWCAIAAMLIAFSAVMVVKNWHTYLAVEGDNVVWLDESASGSRRNGTVAIAEICSYRVEPSDGDQPVTGDITIWLTGGRMVSVPPNVRAASTRAFWKYVKARNPAIVERLRDEVESPERETDSHDEGLRYAGNDALPVRELREDGLRVSLSWPDEERFRFVGTLCTLCFCAGAGLAFPLIVSALLPSSAKRGTAMPGGAVAVVVGLAAALVLTAVVVQGVISGALRWPAKEVVIGEREITVLRKRRGKQRELRFDLAAVTRVVVMPLPSFARKWASLAWIGGGWRRRCVIAGDLREMRALAVLINDAVSTLRASERTRSGGAPPDQRAP